MWIFILKPEITGRHIEKRNKETTYRKSKDYYMLIPIYKLRGGPVFAYQGVGDELFQPLPIPQVSPLIVNASYGLLAIRKKKKIMHATANFRNIHAWCSCFPGAPEYIKLKR